MPGSSDYKVEIVDSSGDADMTVSVIGDQVVDLTGATDGEVLTVQGDGTVAPEALPSPTVHYVGEAGEPAFANSWANLDVQAGHPPGATYSHLRFMKDAFGFVHILGTIAGGSNGTVFTLPAGFRPANIELSFGRDADNVFGLHNVDPSGAFAVAGVTNSVFVAINVPPFLAV